MRSSWARDVGAPPPEQLAAYADGQLDPALCRRVESWLRHHPEVAADIEGQRQLARLWQATRPAEPAAARWAILWAGIAARVPQGMRRTVARAAGRGSKQPSAAPVVIRSGRWPRLLRLGAAGGLAAGLLLLLLPRGAGPLNGTPRKSLLPGSEATATVAPFAVVAPDEVDIVSLRADDRVTLVVGEPPVTEALVLASPADVEVESVEPDADGMVPDIHLDEGSVTALIVAPVGAARERR